MATTTLRSEGAEAALLVGRICLAAIFLWSGVGKIGDFGGFAGNLASQGLPAPMLGALIAVVLEAGGAALVILGLLTRAAAAGLILFTIAATLIAHDFWTLAGPERQMQQIQFMKNLGLIGGFFLLIGSGPAAFRSMPCAGVRAPWRAASPLERDWRRAPRNFVSNCVSGGSCHRC